jgi:hypothetical protein
VAWWWRAGAAAHHQVADGARDHAELRAVHALPHRVVGTQRRRTQPHLTRQRRRRRLSHWVAVGADPKARRPNRHCPSVRGGAGLTWPGPSPAFVFHCAMFSETISLGPPTVNSSQLSSSPSTLPASTHARTHASASMSFRTQTARTRIPAGCQQQQRGADQQTTHTHLPVSTLRASSRASSLWAAASPARPAAQPQPGGACAQASAGMAGEPPSTHLVARTSPSPPRTIRWTRAPPGRARMVAPPALPRAPRLHRGGRASIVIAVVMGAAESPPAPVPAQPKRRMADAISPRGCRYCAHSAHGAGRTALRLILSHGAGLHRG